MKRVSMLWSESKYVDVRMERKMGKGVWRAGLNAKIR